MSCPCDRLTDPLLECSPICIGDLWIFRNLKQDEQVALASAATRKRLEPGTPLFLEGDQADALFLIKGGRIKLSKLMEDGSELILDIRKPGDFVGENMLAEQGNYPVSAWSLQESLCCGFSRGQLEQVILNNPNIGLQIIRNLSERIGWLTNRVGSLASSGIEERLFQVLEDIAREHGIHDGTTLIIDLPLTHEDLGFLIGAHRVTVSRALKSLRQSGKIQVEGKRFLLATREEAG